MNIDFSGDPMCPLGELRAIHPDDAWEGRVHARCVAALVRERRPAAVLASRLVDVALVTAICLYVMAVVTTALALAAAG